MSAADGGSRGRLHSPSAWLRWILTNTRRIAAFVVGVALIGAGLAMLVLPGPGVLVSVVGLAVLATEFAWAERMLDRAKARAASATGAVNANRKAKAAALLSALALLIGGVTAAIIAAEHRALGVSVAVAGLGALVALSGPVQRWAGATTESPPPSGDASA